MPKIKQKPRGFTSGFQRVDKPKKQGLHAGRLSRKVQNFVFLRTLLFVKTYYAIEAFCKTKC